jgi:hypothetical protein
MNFVHLVAKYFLPVAQVAQKILAHFPGLSGLVKLYLCAFLRPYKKFGN